MTIIDSSVVIAILFEEPDAAELANRLVESRKPTMSVVNMVEAAVVADRNPNKQKSKTFDALIADFEIELAVVDVRQALEARAAYEKYGKGRHPARLNLGDCFAYALAKISGEPLLFKGTDFAQTDVKTVS